MDVCIQHSCQETLKQTESRKSISQNFMTMLCANCVTFKMCTEDCNLSHTECTLFRHSSAQSAHYPHIHQHNVHIIHTFINTMCIYFTHSSAQCALSLTHNMMRAVAVNDAQNGAKHSCCTVWVKSGQCQIHQWTVLIETFYLIQIPKEPVATHQLRALGYYPTIQTLTIFHWRLKKFK